MTYTEDGGRVTLDMTRDEWETLLCIVATANGYALRQQDQKRAFRILAFANQLNATNPDWTPFEVPDEYAPDAPR